MCMEDIRIGRESTSQIKSVRSTGAVPVRAASANTKRIAITICSDAGFLGCCFPGGGATGIGAGIMLPTSSPNFTATFENVGSLLWGEWFIEDVGGAMDFTVIDTALYKE